MQGFYQTVGTSIDTSLVLPVVVIMAISLASIFDLFMFPFPKIKCHDVVLPRRCFEAKEYYFSSCPFPPAKASDIIFHSYEASVDLIF